MRQLNSAGGFSVLAVGLLAVSSSSILIRWTGDTPSLVVAAYRLTIAGVILAALSFGRDGSVVPIARRREWLLISLAGVALALHFAFWIASLPSELSKTASHMYSYRTMSTLVIKLRGTTTP